MDGPRLRDIVKDVLNGKDQSDAVKVDVVQIMDDDEAEEARLYFVVF